MKRFLAITGSLLIGALALVAGEASAQNVVDGVDRGSQAYRTAYLKTNFRGTCDVNLQQDASPGKPAFAPSDPNYPLFRKDRVQYQACLDAAVNGGRYSGRDAAGGTGGLH